MKFVRNILKMPKSAIWLLPGLEVKRWFMLLIVGTIVSVIGLCIVLNLRPVYFLIKIIMQAAQTLPSDIIGYVFILLGAVLFFIGWQKTNYSILDTKDNRNSNEVLEDLYRRRKLNRGPKIVAIGGGTGLSTMLKGIKQLTNNITAVVTVGDDGGSSGRLRHDLGVLPPGDIRNCIAALADDEDLVTKLFQYRFKNGEGLEGHSFGNLFLSALCAITGDMVRAVKESSKVLSIRGRVLPATLDDMRLVATMEDGSIVEGESNIPESGKKIVKMATIPSDCKALEDVITAIHSADLIILGPGSLFTSVIPNLLVKEIADAVINSNAKKIYVCNMMTQPGETDGFSVSDHLRTIMEHVGGKKIVDAVLVNDVLPKAIIEKYKSAGSVEVILDRENVEKLGVSIYQKHIINDETQLVRHAPRKLAKAIYYWFRRQERAGKK